MIPPIPSPPAPFGGVPAHHSGERNHPPTRVVIHSAVMPCKPGMADRLAQMNAEGATAGSWHYSVDPEAVRQCSWDRFVCWHAPPNDHSIGIEMADTPGPVPNMPRRSAAYAAAKRAWRWVLPAQRSMLDLTAQLTAQLLLAYGLPVRHVGVKGLREGRRGWTTHAEVSKAWGQSTHWDPGFWPRYSFGRRVKRHARKLSKQGA